MPAKKAAEKRKRPQQERAAGKKGEKARLAKDYSAGKKAWLGKGKQVQEAKPEAKKAEAEKEKHAKEAKAKAEKAETEKEKHAKEAKAKAEKAETEKEKHVLAGQQAGKEAAEKKAVVGEEKRPVKISKGKEVKRLSRLVLAKKRRLFRGRFGKRSIRKVGNKKWQRWRKPRGIDIYFYREDGLVPGRGYRTPKQIRFVHPSGYREKPVRNMNELLALQKEKQAVAARLSHCIGGRKKAEILKKADELKIVVLNR